jgi:hypothetical protein
MRPLIILDNLESEALNKGKEDYVLFGAREGIKDSYQVYDFLFYGIRGISLGAFETTSLPESTFVVPVFGQYKDDLKATRDVAVRIIDYSFIEPIVMNINGFLNFYTVGRTPSSVTFFPPQTYTSISEDLLYTTLKGTEPNFKKKVSKMRKGIDGLFS